MICSSSGLILYATKASESFQTKASESLPDIMVGTVAVMMSGLLWFRSKTSFERFLWPPVAMACLGLSFLLLLDWDKCFKGVILGLGCQCTQLIGILIVAGHRQFARRARSRRNPNQPGAP